jgi:hypothetical protein
MSKSTGQSAAVVIRPGARLLSKGEMLDKVGVTYPTIWKLMRQVRDRQQSRLARARGRRVHRQLAPPAPEGPNRRRAVSQGGDGSGDMNRTNVAPLPPALPAAPSATPSIRTTSVICRRCRSMPRPSPGECTICASSTMTGACSSSPGAPRIATATSESSDTSSRCGYE